ncbi:hypothetical protein SEVIR_5G211401v4 [Setaria viridis]
MPPLLINGCFIPSFTDLLLFAIYPVVLELEIQAFACLAFKITVFFSLRLKDVLFINAAHNPTSFYYQHSFQLFFSALNHPAAVGWLGQVYYWLGQYALGVLLAMTWRDNYELMTMMIRSVGYRSLKKLSLKKKRYWLRMPVPRGCPKQMQERHLQTQEHIGSKAVSEDETLEQS